ncbi:MAG: hypothetical protein L6R42_008554 [Xanthoria sp. 1 TBL-2021]|nr:MAG: hypothetical protein L6R42_008554 [Xanthoria sp. 1 TBL-2021]
MNTASQPPPFSPNPSGHGNPFPEKQSSNGALGISPAPPATAAPRVRRRNRMITSCLECRRRKLKCDKSHPCANCTKNTRDCVFLAPALDSASQMRLTEIKEKMGSLERVLEQDVARNSTRPQSWKADPEGEQVDFAPEPEDEKNLEPTPLATADAVYDDDADDDLADLGFAMGRMRLSDRIGGFFRPKMAEELSVSLNDDVADNHSQSRKSLSPEAPIPHHVTSPQYNKFLAPGPTYIAPSSSFFFSSGQSSASLIDYLPSKIIANRLLNQYWLAVHPICRIVHRPSFQRRYDTFWADVEMGVEPTGSLQAVVFAALFSGVVSMSDNAVLMAFGTSKKDLVDNFQMGTETALGRANVIRTTKVETLQALVMYMIPLCRGEISRSHSALVGTALRIAECMGLHRDGTEYGFGPVETHVRRLIWYHICFLDIRTCEAQGPRPHIRSDEFDTQFPLNVDDEELEALDPPTTSASRWTDMTLTLIRMEANEMCRIVWVDRQRLEKKKISLTSVLGKIENFRKIMKDKYLRFINDNIPIQHLGRQICEIVTLRMHIMVLHRYHNSVSYQIPDRLRQIIISSGTEIMERAISLETSPALSPWAWYSSAIQQYHTALLLLMEIFAFPNRKEADRIWRCLDYVFEIPSNIPKDQRGRWVMTEIRDKMGIYIASRKVMAPSSMLERIGNQSTRSGNTSSASPPAAVGKVQQGNGDFAYGYAPGVTSQHTQGPETLRSDAPPFSGPAPQAAMPVSAPPIQGDKTIDIDWHEWDKLFPPDSNPNYMS